MKLIGLDVGAKRIGVAFGDSEMRLATPVGVIERKSIDADARALAHYLREYDAAQWIVGLPRNMDDSRGFQAETIVRYAEQLANVVAVRPLFWDERLTTIEATRRLHEIPAHTKRKSRATLDALAAAVILQDYLDTQTS
ncbi:MAG: Holliday junction resolvase RuvX [Chloroflexi bacterium]|nr:Holliday junction resolvase RuvX [Chloroflexota bacterium]